MKKNSNFELLRIVSMWAIVAHHFVLHTGILDQALSANRIIAQLYNIGAYIGVNAFFMISGWFCAEHKFKSARIWKVYSQTLFYSLAFFVLFVVLKPESFSLGNLLKSVFPVTFSSWWFVTAYIGMMLLSPFINSMLRAINARQFNILMVTCVVMFFGLHTFTTQRPFFSNLAMACVYYTLAAGCRLFRVYERKELSKIVSWPGFILSVCVIALSTVVFSFGEKFVPAAHEGINFLTGIDTLTIFASTFITFGLVVNSAPRYSSLVNFIGARTFAIYLIQSNFLVAGVLWDFIEKTGINEHPFYFVLAPLVVTAICAGCILIEQVRIMLASVLKRFIKKDPLGNCFSKIDSLFN